MTKMVQKNTISNNVIGGIAAAVAAVFTLKTVVDYIQSMEYLPEYYTVGGLLWNLLTLAALAFLAVMLLMKKRSALIAVGFGVCMGWIWPVGLSLWIPFLVGVVLTRYVSVGSIAAAISLPVWLLIYYPQSTLAMKVIFAIMALLVVWAHRSNIKKLMQGTESKLSLGKKKE